MKLQFCAFLLLASYTHAATLQVLPNSQNLGVGDPLTVSLEISGLGAGTAPSVGTFDIDLGYDPTVLSFVNATYGTGLDIFGLGDLQFTTPGTGAVNLFELSLDSADDINSLQPASFVLATLDFTALADGASPLSLNLNALGDADGNALPATLQDGSATVGDSSSAPEPASMLLLSGGIVAFSVYRRYIRTA